MSTHYQNKPARFPVSFNEMLRRMIGGKYAYDRQPIFKAFLRHKLTLMGKAKNPFVNESALAASIAKQVDEFVAHYRANGLTEDQFGLYSGLPQWLPEYRRLKRVAKATGNANKRWSQERRPKANLKKLSKLDKEPGRKTAT